MQCKATTELRYKWCSCASLETMSSMITRSALEQLPGLEGIKHERTNLYLCFFSKIKFDDPLYIPLTENKN